MARTYCIEDDVKTYLPSNFVVEGSNPTPNFRNPNPESITNIDLSFFIEEASNMIDGRIGNFYDVPLKKVNFGGEEQYPGIIKRLTAMWAAKMILQRPMQGVDQQHSETVKDLEKWVEDQISDIVDGTIVLWGQRRTRAQRFVRQTLRDTTYGQRKSGGER